MPRRAGVVPGDLHREEDALGAARRQRAGSGAVPNRPQAIAMISSSMLQQARVLERVERVVVEEAAGDLLEQVLELLVVDVVDEAERPPAPPVDVAGGHRRRSSASSSAGDRPCSGIAAGSLMCPEPSPHRRSRI